MKDQTVVLIKPDGVRKGIVGEILARFERVGLKIAAAKMIWVDKTFVGKHYQDKADYHKTVGTKTLENYQKFGLDANESLGTKDPVKIGKMVRKWNMEFLSSGPVFAMLLQGPDAVLIVRKIVGSTFSGRRPSGHNSRGFFSGFGLYIKPTKKNYPKCNSRFRFKGRG